MMIYLNADNLNTSFSTNIFKSFQIFVPTASSNSVDLRTGRSLGSEVANISTTTLPYVARKFLVMKPHFATGEVIKGFGRGSKELGIPTANFPDEVVNNLPDDINTGIYFGFAQINSSPVYKMVMSIGKNPYYKNERKSMETHIMHQFDEDFYGQIMKIVILGYIRPEKNFKGVDELIAAINDDIKTAKEQLDEDIYKNFKTDSHFL